MTFECILLENALFYKSAFFSFFFVQNVVFLMKPMCIQVVIKHEHMKIEKKQRLGSLF